MSKKPKAIEPVPTAAPAENVPQHYERLDITRIEVSGANPRKEFDQEALKELADSIREHGILEPLVVRPVGNKDLARYELIAGERRFRAAQLVGLVSVPCMIRELSDTAAKEIMLLENLQREDLAPLEVANALQQLLVGDMTQEDLGRKLGKSQGWISNHLRLLKAPEDLQQLLISREITPKHAQVLLPFVGFPAVYGEAMKQLQREAKDGPVTVSRLSHIVAGTIGNDYSGERVLNFTNPGWKHAELVPFMDKEACKGCESRVEVELGNKKNLVCLKPECFKPKLKDAEALKNKDRVEERKEMLDGKKPVNLDLLSYSEYDRLKHADFDTAECQVCKSNRKTKAGEEVCLDPQCYARKRGQARKDKQKATEDHMARAGDVANAYVAARSGPLNPRELRLFLETIADSYDFDADESLAHWIPDAEDIEFESSKEYTDAVPDEDLPKALLSVIFHKLIFEDYSADHLQLIKDIGELDKPSTHVVKVPRPPEAEEEEEDGQEDAGELKGYMCSEGDDDEVYGTLPAARETLGCDECPLKLDGDCSGPQKVHGPADDQDEADPEAA